MAYIVNQDKIIDWLKKNLSPSRFQHTLAVTNLACKLAAIHKCDIKQSYLAGILHDCSKGMSHTELKKYARKHNLSSFRRGPAPELLHSHVAAHIAQTKFGISDKYVLHAIASHTTGVANPSLLDKILYIADTASTDRTFPEVAHIRRIALKNLNMALLCAMEIKIMYVLKKRFPLHTDTALIWNNWLKLK